MRKHGKIVFKEFGGSFGRFMAIAGIIMLSLAFVIGINNATPDIKTSYERYFADNAFYDFYLYPDDEPTVTEEMGTYMGQEVVTSVTVDSVFTSEDADKIAGVEDVESVQSVIYYDAVVRQNSDGTGRVARLFGVDDMHDMRINKLTLKEGALPAAPNEAVAIIPFGNMEKVSLGDVFTVSDEYAYQNTEIDLGDMDMGGMGVNVNVIQPDPLPVFAEETGNKFKVVGIVSSPMYFSKSNETCTIGNGNVDYILFTDKSSFSDIPTKFDMAYTPSFTPSGISVDVTITPDPESYVPMISTMWVSAKGSADITPFTDDYDDFSKEVGAKIEAAAEDGWYVLDRDTNISYYGLKFNADKVTAIAGVFPIFFIAVAALVAFSTIVRMVDEDRGQIATLTSLGYGKPQIVSKYIFYGIAACLLGALVGVPLGITVLPIIIFNAYGTLYTMPPMTIMMNWFLTLLSVGIAIVSVVLVALLACYSSLRETPASLLQPRAPKPGKRILLERVPLWNVLPFRYKATFRNIFRFKRNFFMTVLAVAGCSALILAGFGMLNSTAAVTDLQFNGIYNYDLTVGVTSNYAEDENMRSFLGSGDDAKDYLEVRKERGSIETEDDTLTLNIVVGRADEGGEGTNKKTDINEFIDFGDHFENDSVFLSKGAATELGLKAGDTIKVKNAAGDVLSFVVSKVVIMYSDSWVFIGADEYDRAYAALGGENADASAFNSILVRSGIAQDDQESVTEELFTYESVTAVSFTSSEKKAFDDTSETITLIVIVLIVFAGALVVIVLYNLTNINIGERKKEIATLKVLGYNGFEVAGYVFREIFILVLLGIAVGIGLGWALLSFIIASLVNPYMLFPVTIYWWSHLIAIGLTIVFSGLVDLLLLRKLSKIDMAESMKAVE